MKYIITSNPINCKEMSNIFLMKIAVNCFVIQTVDAFLHMRSTNRFRYGSSSDSAIWMIGAAGAGRDVVYNTANLIGVDPSMRIPLCMIL